MSDTQVDAGVERRYGYSMMLTGFVADSPILAQIPHHEIHLVPLHRIDTISERHRIPSHRHVAS